MHRLAFVALVACGGTTAPPASNRTSPAPVTSAQHARCLAIADHFEPWRANPLWAQEVSPRAQLIHDCEAHAWGEKLAACILANNSPIEMDACVGLDPKL